jgi:hypothetical protein
MATFAKLDDNNIVTEVIVCDEKMVKLLPDPEKWIQTSRNTIGGIHLLGGTPFRKNYATIGSSYDEERDAFIPPKLHPSFVLDEDTCQWIPPLTRPPEKEGYLNYWDFEKEVWVEELIPPEEQA